MTGAETAGLEVPARRILDFLAVSEALKRELRHSWLSDGRRESVAEHSYQMCLIALLVEPLLRQPMDMGKVFRMILVHDLVEALCGDVPWFETGPRKDRKAAAERAAIDEIRRRIGSPVGLEVHALWHEFEARETDEARLAAALDAIEVQVQHNLAPLSTWEPVEHDLIYNKLERPTGDEPILSAIASLLQADAEQKLAEAGIDVFRLRERNGRSSVPISKDHEA